MLGRCRALTNLRGCLALPVALLLAGNAHAHRLDAQAFLKDGKVQIEAWFPSSGPAKGAKVEVFQAGAQLLTEGRTNDDGIFVFALQEPQALQVVISDGAGHRKELSISREAFGQTSASPLPPAPGEASVKPVALADRDSGGLPLKDVLVGLSFLLALAAFVMSLRNARRLRELANEKKA
jgi:hypothetical protein